MKFSQRKGITPILDQIQLDVVSTNLRIRIWNILYFKIFDQDNQLSIINKYGYDYAIEIIKIIHIRYFIDAVDKLPSNYDQVIDQIKKYLLGCDWFAVYDFLESLLDVIKKESFYKTLEGAINQELFTELSGYRFINGICTDIISDSEISEIKKVLSDDKFGAAQEHMTRALELLYNREKPDYRNSIKESISAVESIAKEISGNTKATLGEALNVLEREKKLHPALKEAFSKLYGYTNDADGIRHALMEESTLTAADAKFFLVSCSAFINYLKSNI